MKISRWFAILAFAGAILVFVGLSSSTALADTLPPDPGWHLCCDTTGTGLFTPTDPNFNFTVNGGSAFSTAHGGTGNPNQLFAVFNFINATGQDAIGVNLDFTLLTGTPALNNVCQDFGDPYFATCTPVTVGTQTEIQFRDPLTPSEITFAGIPHATDLTSVEQCDGVHFCSTNTPGAGFKVEVFDVNSDLVGLLSTQGETVQGTLLVPEPSTVLLLVAGLLFLFLFRRARWIPNPNFKL